MYSYTPRWFVNRTFRDIGDNILFLFLFLVLDPLVGFEMHLLPVLGWAFFTLASILGFVRTNQFSIHYLLPDGLRYPFRGIQNLSLALPQLRSYLGMMFRAPSEDP
jgi:hypothetical protein